MIGNFHKSRSVTIFKSLATSPAGICFGNTIIILLLITIFYGIYLFNIYLISVKIGAIYPAESSALKSDAIMLIFLELAISIVVILLLFLVYFAVNDIIKCIYDTKQKLSKDINEYECNAVSWQK